MNVQKEFYRDFYGCTYSIRKNNSNSFSLIGRLPQGDAFHVQKYSSYRGAKIALGRISDGTAELTGRKEYKS